MKLPRVRIVLRLVFRRFAKENSGEHRGAREFCESIPNRSVTTANIFIAYKLRTTVSPRQIYTAKSRESNVHSAETKVNVKLFHLKQVVTLVVSGVAVIVPRDKR